MQKRMLLKMPHSLTMLILKRLLLAISMGCLVATVNAAPMDDAKAAYNKGDYKEAVRWYRLSADQGNAEAQERIGVMYHAGYGVIQDYKEALKWLRLSAAKGYAAAQNHIGGMHYNGDGVTQDYILAHMWFNLSSSAGGVNGAKNRGSVAKEMTPQQIEKAQDMARECQARNFKGC